MTRTVSLHPAFGMDHMSMCCKDISFLQLFHEFPKDPLVPELSVVYFGAVHSVFWKQDIEG